jgi:guanylate kinase
MHKFNEEVSHWQEYNYIVVNDDLDKCYNKILSIINSEKKGIKVKQNLDQTKNIVEELIK